MENNQERKKGKSPKNEQKELLLKTILESGISIQDIEKLVSKQVRKETEQSNKELIKQTKKDIRELKKQIKSLQNKLNTKIKKLEKLNPRD